MGFELINTKLYVECHPRPSLFQEHTLLTHSRRLADQFAANGFTTIIPDVWEGDNVPLNYEPGSDFDLGQWVGRHPPSKVEPICEATIKAMKQEYGVKKLGAAGFCLGAKYVCRFMAKGKGLDAGYIAHPSLTSGDEVRGVDEPLTIAGAEVDDLFPPEKRRETEEILSSSGNRYSMTIYGGVEHGFGLKADLNNPWSKFVSETVFLQAVSWFDHFLKV